MPEKIFSIIHLGLFFLCISLFLSCGKVVTASNSEEKSPVLKTQHASSAEVSGKGVSMRVLWTVSKYIMTERATWDEKEARKLLFKPLDMDVNYITFDGKTCSDVTFKKETVKTKEYLENVFHTTPQKLGISEETVEVIKSSCNLPGFDEYLRLKDKQLVIQINGVFFFLEPAINY